MGSKRRPDTGGKVDVPMAPMIDIVFQLLIFFMLQLKIMAPEGNFDINMPLGQSSQQSSDAPLVPDIKIKLISDDNGNLAQLKFGERNLGVGDGAFEALGAEVLKIIGTPGNPATKDIEVEIDADYELHYEYVIKAVSHCTGKIDPQTKQLVRYVEKIKFAPPRLPKNS
ncbi:biopolymer transporter ExbD [Planctopirus hydrillae]|jgi:biopolymer transport protein ExbD|uniref:Biopolymer transporter ExbD n=2 Tax=Planctopirus hydrillae TaxID=1841610 RepID=A0A1C3EJD8_9PLAN|nr:biopolymer transporter ExbD [Planctopirus hydrillae]